MSRIKAKNLDQHPDLKMLMENGASRMGFLPMDGLIMAHCPEMLKGTGALINSILHTGTVEPGLKRMIGFIVSQAAGCQYCSAHTTYSALKCGIEEKKMKAIWEFQTSEIFSNKEKAALQFAHHAGMMPNACTDDDYEALKKYFSIEEIVELVFTISLYAL